jgi:hypothetical protein
MVDLVSVGAFVAAVLSLAGETVLKAGVTDAVKDAYKALKTKVSHWAAEDADQLENSPKSKARQAVVAEKVDSLPASDQETLREFAELLLRTLKEEPRAVGVDIGRVEALDMQLGKISVSSGIGARIKSVKVTGKFSTRDIQVGNHVGKPER